MKFKHESDKREWADIGKWASEANLMLRELLWVLDKLSILLGFGEITITAYIKDGSHDHGTAGDIRVKDKGKFWYWCMVGILACIRALNSRFIFNAHHEHFGSWMAGDPTSEAHIHVRVLDKAVN